MRKPVQVTYDQKSNTKQQIHRSKNGYGALVIKSPTSQGGAKGLWELSVLKFYGSKTDEYEIDCSTYITDKSLGELSESDVEFILQKIETLPVSTKKQSEKVKLFN
jgi:hypothetical protein